jgi:hypothetical protein
MGEAFTSTGKEALVKVISDEQESVPLNLKVFHEPDPTSNLAAEPDHRPQMLHLSIERLEPASESVQVPSLRDVLVADSVREFERFREKLLVVALPATHVE